MARIEDESWLDDAFDEKKAAAQPKGLTSGSKVAVGVGCAAVIAIALIASVFGVVLLFQPI